MSPLRKTALVAGVFYLLTFVSIPTLVLYGPVRDPNYIVGSGPDTAGHHRRHLEIIVALAGIGTAVALFPVVKRQNEGVALGLRRLRGLWKPRPSSLACDLMTMVTCGRPEPEQMR